MNDYAPRGVLRIGDRVRFDGREQMVVGLAGTTVRLQDGHGTTALVLFAHLVAAEDFELLAAQPAAVPLPPFGMLDTVPGPVLARAQLWERHLIEVETGLPPDSAEDARPRPEYDPRWRTLSERVAAKAAELAASGMPASERTIQRLRACWQDQGLWGLVDGRATRVHSPAGRADERFVAAVVEVLAAQESMSTGTRSRVLRQVRRLLAERYGEGVVPIPARASFYRLVNALAAGRRTFGPATTRRSQARRPEAPFTPTMAARPGEVVQIDTTPLDVLAVWDDGVTGRVELTGICARPVNDRTSDLRISVSIESRLTLPGTDLISASTESSPVSSSGTSGATSARSRDTFLTDAPTGAARSPSRLAERAR